MKKSKSILITSVFSLGGGAEKVMTHIANYFTNQGYRVVYATIYNNGYYQLNDCVEKKIFAPKKKSGGIKDLIDIRAFLKSNEFDAIIAFGYTISTKIALATIGMKCSKKIIMSERNDPERNVNSRIKKVLRDFAYSRSAKMVFQTEDAKRYFSKKIQNKGTIILNPLFVPENDELIERRPGRVIAAGRITAQKNFTLLINAFAKFSAEYPDYYLDIYGDPDGNNEYEKLIDLIKALKIDDKIKINGFSDRIINEFYGSEVYVSSSNYEGLSNSMLEAMACGTVVICTDCPCGGARMVIENKKNGLLVPTNDVDSLTAALKFIADNSSQIKNLSKKAMNIKQKLSIDVIGNEWKKIVDEL